MKTLLSLSAFLLSCMLIGTPQATAAPLLVGDIKVLEYSRFSDGTLGGVDFLPHFTLNAKFDEQDCCERDDIRWLQRVTSSKPTGFTPDPNRPFIDPRTGQDIGGGDVGDGLPFYDITYATLADAKVDNDRITDGSGRFLVDSPRVLLERGPYTFTSETLLVCLEEMTMAILGGVRWGFTIGADQMTVTPLALVELSDSAALRASFNAALALDFPGWTIAAATELWPDVQPKVKVPEPSTLILLGCGLLLFIIVCYPRGRVASSIDEGSMVSA